MATGVQRMIRGAIMVGLQPVVFLVCGVYAGAVYGGIVGAVRGARDQRPESETFSIPALNPQPKLVPAMVRSR